jgi:hypothetical protein
MALVSYKRSDTGETIALLQGNHLPTVRAC